MKKIKPINIAQWQIPPMRDWEAFERLCLDLWKEILDDPNAQRVGRSGQRQHGVDIIGKSRATGKSVGIQCKKKDVMYADDTLKNEDICEIVEEAKTFEPPLSELVIAYIGKRDADLQKEARLITEKHRACDLFSVLISSWDDIQEALGNFSNVFSKHFPQFEGVNIDADELGKRIDSLQDSGEKSGRLSTRAGISTTSEKIVKEIAQSTAYSLVVVSEHDAEIDHARDLINDMKPKEALDYLEKIEKRIWHNADPLRRYRILTNKASALSSIGQFDKSGRLFIEALQYNPSDEKAICNRAIGHLQLDQLPQAEEFARKVLEMNPASARAYGILVSCSPQSESLEEVIQKIPMDMRKNEDVAFAIAAAARKRGETNCTIHWLRVTLDDAEKSGKKKNPDLIGNLATAILESVMKSCELLSGIQLTTEDKERLEEAINLLTDAINTFTSENLVYRTYWIANRSTAYKLTGQLDRAIADMETVLRLQPNDAVMTKQYAFILILNNQRARAIESLRTILDKPEVPEAALILAGILHEEGKSDEARAILESKLTEDFETKLFEEMQRLLIQIHIKQSNIVRAREISVAVREVNPTNVLNLVDAARIEKHAGNIDIASRLLDEAIGYVSDKTQLIHMLELADELYINERFPDAWHLYEQIADPKVDTYLIKNLLYSYYRAGETEKAVQLLKCIPPENKNSFIIQIELSVLEAIGDLTSAAETAELYLQTHSEDLETLIHLAAIWYRTDQPEQLKKLDAFLDQDFDVSKLPLIYGFQLAGLLGERDRAEKALKIAYDIRRINYNNGEAHLKYVGIIFGREPKLDVFMQPTVEVRPGMAVRTMNDEGQETWYILEDREDLNVPMGELSTKSNFGMKILGKKVGDKIITAEGSIDNVKITIAEIKNKYVRALHESLRLLPERFGDTKGIERVTFKSGSDEETKQSIQKMLNVVEKRNEWVMQAEKFYNESKLTVGAFAQIIQNNVIDVWNNLVGSVWGIKSCLGTLEERQKAFEVLSESRSIVMDITSLLTAERLNILNILEKRFDKIHVAQSTFDLFLEAISDRKGLKSRGYFKIGKEDNDFVKRDISAENVKSQIDYLERLKKWAHDHCEVTPLKMGSKPGQTDRQRELLGASFVDTINIARQQGCCFYTDDFGTKMIALNEFGVDSFWTQAMLMSAVTDKLITEEEYNDAVVQLIHLNYRHTSVSGQVILHAAKKSNWSNTNSFEEILKSLRGTQMEIHSTIGVFVEFMFHLWLQPVLDVKRDALVMAALDILSNQRDIRIVAHLMHVAVEFRFRIVPLAGSHVQQVISAWETLKINPKLF